MCGSSRYCLLLLCVIASFAFACPVLAETSGDAANTAAESRVKRLESLYKAGEIPKSEFEEAQDQAALLRAQRANDDDQVAKINLSRAERRLNKLAVLRKAGVIPQSELEQAQDQVALSQAALANDKNRVAAIRAKMTERKLNRIEALRKGGAVPQQELEQARSQVESLRKEVGIPNAAKSENR